MPGLAGEVFNWLQSSGKAALGQGWQSSYWPQLAWPAEPLTTTIWNVTSLNSYSQPGHRQKCEKAHLFWGLPAMEKQNQLRQKWWIQQWLNWWLGVSKYGTGSGSRRFLPWRSPCCWTCQLCGKLSGRRGREGFEFCGLCWNISLMVILGGRERNRRRFSWGSSAWIQSASGWLMFLRYNQRIKQIV